jgi:hypothetical protein
MSLAADGRAHAITTGGRERHYLDIDAVRSIIDGSAPIVISDVAPYRPATMGMIQVAPSAPLMMR